MDLYTCANVSKDCFHGKKMVMKMISIKCNTSFPVGIERAEQFMNITYCLCLAKVFRRFEKITTVLSFISPFIFQPNELRFV